MRRALAALIALIAPVAAFAQPTPNLGALTATELDITDGAGNSQPTLTWFNSAGPAYRTNNTVTLSSFPSLPVLRQNWIQTTINNPTNSSAIWLQDNSYLYNNGPGTANGELNLQHSYFENHAGAHAVSVNAHESSVLNTGAIDTHTAYLSIYQNDPGGTSNAVYGLHAWYQNNNTTAGSIGTWAAFGCEGRQGTGSAATNSYCVRNGDPNSDIASLGHVGIGTLSHLPGMLQVNGPDTAAGTLALVIKNSAQNTFLVDDSGVVTAPVQIKSPWLTLTGTDTSAGTQPLQVKNSAGFTFTVDDSGVVNAPIAFKSPSVVLTGPDTAAGTVPFMVKNSAINTFWVDDSGVVNAPTQLKSASAIFTGPDTSSGTVPLVVKNSAGNTFTVDDSGLVSAPTSFRTGTITINGLDNAAGTNGLLVRNLAGTVGFSVNNAGGISSGTLPGANCAAGTVSLTTLVVTNGIVTHC